MSGTPSQAALSLHWTLGLNKDISHGVHNLSDGSDPEANKEMFYVAAHTGIVLNYTTGEQKLLQGHVNPITAVTVSDDYRFIITADTGVDSMMVVWDRVSCCPVRTYFRPHPNGVLSVDLSPNSEFLVSLSSPSHFQLANEDDAPCQQLAIWGLAQDLQEGKTNQTPLASAMVGTQDLQNTTKFNAWDVHEISTNGKRRVFFWTWEPQQPVQFYSPALAARDFKQRVGDFTQTIFLPECTQAATATCDGDVVLWDLSLIVDGLSRPDERRAVKIIRLCPDVSINVMMLQAPYVVIGSADGSVKFYDYQFRVQAWFEDLSAGAVKAISFERSSIEGPAVFRASGQKEEEVDGEPLDFQCSPFIVATGSALVVQVDPMVFYELDPDNRRGNLILQGLDSPVFGICCHPSSRQVAVCGYSGFLQVWDYESRTLQLVKIFEKLVPQTITYSPCGILLALGFTNGACKILRAHDLSEVVSFRDSRDSISHLTFSPDSAHLATAHLSKCVCLYRFAHRNNDSSLPASWIPAGKHKSHWQPIVGLTFSGKEAVQRGEPLRLFSIGEDRRLIEYDVLQSSDFSGLQIARTILVSQEGKPTGCMIHPWEEGSGLRVITFDDEYKLKSWDIGSQGCRGTFLGPTFGGPLSSMIPIPAQENQEERYVLYSSANKVTGVLSLPLDGNPSGNKGIISHPGQVASVSVDFEGKYAFTAGGNDVTVNMWKLDTDAVKEAKAMAGEGITPFLSLVEGGAEGSFFSEAKDFFYYAQIRSQSEDTTLARKLDGTVPINQLPYLMSALGFYPSELDIKNLTNEVRYSGFQETGNYVDRITFDQFLKLYVNHRPVFGVGPAQVQEAFKTLCRLTGIAEDELGPSSLPIEALTMLLTGQPPDIGFTAGEGMEKEELERILETLCGSTDLSEVFGHALSPIEFTEDILGLSEVTTSTEEPAQMGEAS